MILKPLRTCRGGSLTRPGRGIASPLQNERGLALLLVLLVITLLVAMVVEFDYKTRIDLRAAGNLRDGLQATYLAKAGVAAAQAALKDDYKNDQRRNPKTDDLTELWSVPLPPLPLGEGTVSVKITDEASKFNLNNLVSKGNHHGVPPAINQARELFRLAQVDPNLVDAIVDWIDTDDNDTPQTFGAEESYYQSLPKPYHCKNKPMDSLSELHMIKGITDEVYEKVSPYLTVSTDLTNGQININTADPIVLQGLGFDEDQTKKLIDNRPIQQVTADLIRVIGQDAYNIVVLRNQGLLPGLLTVTSNVFSVEAQGRAHDIEKTVYALLDRQSGVVRIKTWRME